MPNSKDEIYGIKDNESHLVMEEDHMDKLYYSKNPLVRFFHNQRISHILDIIPKGRELRILDAGCGEGHLIEKIHNLNPRHLLFGFDITKIALESAKKRVPEAKFSLQDLTKLNISKEFFDIIICQDVLEHIYDYKKVILNLINLLKKDGIFIISYPNEKNLTFSRFVLGIKPSKIKDHVNSFNPNKMNKEINMDCIKKKNLPLNLPFPLSLESIQVFKK